MHRIIYTSSTSDRLSENDYRNIALKASVNNKTYGITGILLFFEGGILQVLEGNQSDIEALFKTIKKDTRHNNISKLIDHPCEEREFPAWSMGFQTVSNMADLDFVFPLTHKNLTLEMPGNQTSETHVLIDTFSKIQRLDTVA